jgi:hypothetical protein
VDDNTRTEHQTRQNILRLLSDDEVSKVSMAETATRPLEGEEYLDLDDMDRGVRSAHSPTAPMSRLVLRRSVQEDTWNKIRAELVALHAAKLPI